MQVQGAKEFFSLFLIFVPRVGNCWKVLDNGVTWSDVLFKERAWLCISGFTGGREQPFSTLALLTFGLDKSFLVRGPVYCRVCCRVPDLYPLDAVVTSSLSRDNQKCVQTLLVRYPWGNQFLVENHGAGVNAGFPLSSRREILLTWLEWWRRSWYKQMGLQRPGDELSSTWVDRHIMMIQSSVFSLLPSFNIPPALKKESGLVLGILLVGWQKDSMWNVKFSFTLL